MTSSPLCGCGKAPWSRPHLFVGVLQSTASYGNDRVEPSPILIFVTPCCPLSPFQTVLAADSRGAADHSSLPNGRVQLWLPGQAHPVTSRQHRTNSNAREAPAFNTISLVLFCFHNLISQLYKCIKSKHQPELEAL